MNVIKKIKGKTFTLDVETTKKDTTVHSKHPSVVHLTQSHEPLFRLIDYEVRGNSVRSIMEQLPEDIKDHIHNNHRMIVWVEKAPAKLLIKRRYLLKNLQKNELHPSQGESCNIELQYFAEEMILF